MLKLSKHLERGSFSCIIGHSKQLSLSVLLFLLLYQVPLLVLLPLPVGHGAVATLATHVVHGPLIHATQGYHTVPIVHATTAYHAAQIIQHLPILIYMQYLMTTPRLLLQKLLMEPGLSLDLTLSLCLM